MCDNNIKSSNPFLFPHCPATPKTIILFSMPNLFLKVFGTGLNTDKSIPLGIISIGYPPRKECFTISANHFEGVTIVIFSTPQNNSFFA